MACICQSNSQEISMACSGNCTIQEFEVRNKSYDNVALDPPNQPRCRPSPPFNDARKAVFDKIDEATKPVSDGCQADCQCVKLANQDPPWTEWAGATIEVAYTQGGCMWKLQGRYEYRTRQFQGLCGPVRTVAAVALIPELALTITARAPITGDQLVAIRDILKSGIAGDLFTPQVKFSVTRIGEVFGPGRVEITAYLDSKNLVAYVSEHHLDTVKALFRAKGNGSELIIPGQYGPQRYVIKSLDALDYSQPINEGDGTVLKDYICRVFSPGDCRNIVSTDTGAFLFSFRAPQSGLSICSRQKDNQCSVIWRTLTVQAFADPDCQGDQVTRTVNFALCSPN